MLKPETIPSIRTTGTNLERAKSHNHRVVLDVVRTRGPMSRADIARITNLSRQTIQNIIAELQQLGLVELSDTLRQGGGGRGHPGVDVRFRAEGGTSLGVHVDPVSMTIVVCDLAGSILWRRRMAVSYPDPPEVTAILKATLVELARDIPAEAEALLGIGIALPGPFNITEISGAQVTTLPRWTDATIDAQLTEAIGLPVVVENDATASCVGEHLFGLGRELESFAYVYIAMGLGAALHLNGEAYLGFTRNAGEIGHMVVEVGGRPCPCGNQGCLERYLSLQAVYEAIGLDHPTVDSVDDVLRLYEARDPRILDWLAMAADKLRLAVNILDSLLDAEAIVINGQLPPPMMEGLIARLDPLLKSVGAGGKARDRVRIGSFYPDSTALGAAALAVRAAISPRIEMLLKGAG